MKELISTLRNKTNIQSHKLGSQSHLFKALVLSTITYGTEIWVGDSHWKVCEKGMKIHMMSHIKCVLR